MYSQVSRNKYGSREIKLVRVCPFDSRVKRHTVGYGTRVGRTIAKKVITLFAMVLLFIGICMIVLDCSGLTMSSAQTKDRLYAASNETEGLAVEECDPSNPVQTEKQPMVSDSTKQESPAEAFVEEPKTPLIVIDPGHGGMDEGCSFKELYEKDINLQLANQLSKQLQQMGYLVELTRTDTDTRISLEERVTMAEELQADLFLSIHQNVGSETSASGIETWYCEKTVEGNQRFASLVHMGALEKTDAKDRGLKESQNLYVIRETSMPACLIETSFLTNPREREAICSKEYQDKLIRGIAQGIDYYFHPKTMYLTFDDGPSEENTVTILDILKQHNIKATFFVIGENVRKHPQVAKRIVEEGHTIGIHCNHHDYKEIYESVESYLTDFEQAYQAVYEVTGVEVKLFRFPGGSINAYNKEVYEDIIAEMTDRGFIYFDWNGSLEDAVKKSTPEKLLMNARESTLKRKKVVMLAHDIVYNTTLCLEDLIEQFPEYQMEPLTAEVTPIQFKKKLPQ